MTKREMEEVIGYCPACGGDIDWLDVNVPAGATTECQHCKRQVPKANIIPVGDPDRRIKRAVSDLEMACASKVVIKGDEVFRAMREHGEEYLLIVSLSAHDVDGGALDGLDIEIEDRRGDEELFRSFGYPSSASDPEAW